MKTIIPKKQTATTSFTKTGSAVRNGISDKSAIKTSGVTVNLIKVPKSVYNATRVKAYKPLIP